MVEQCYVYRSQDCREETLVEHITGIFECIQRRWEFHGLIKKLSRLLNVKEDTIRWLVMFSALLHDIAKTSATTQETCRATYCVEFRYHYVISAMLATSLGRRSGLLRQRMDEKMRRLLLTSDEEQSTLDIEGLYLTIVVLPVLLHHYAGISESSIDEGLRSSDLSLEIDQICARSLLDIFKQLEQNAPQEVTRLVIEFRKLVEERKVELVPLSGLRPFLESYEPSFAKVLVESVTGLLNICDGKVAAKNRSQIRNCK